MAQFNGVITWIGEIRSGESNGKPWQSQDIEVTELAQTQYPQKVIVTFNGDKLNQFKAMLVPNASVIIDFDYVVRTWENKRFMNLRGWNVKPYMVQQPMYQPQQPVPQYQAQPQPQYQAQPQPIPQQAPVQAQPQYQPQPQVQPQPQQMPQTEYPFPPPSSY